MNKKRIEKSRKSLKFWGEKDLMLEKIFNC